MREEINGKEVAVIFAGTTHVCEAMVIFVRFVSENWQIELRVIRLIYLPKALNAFVFKHSSEAAVFLCN